MKFQPKYHAGDTILGIAFIKELPNNGKYRMGVFKCPFCEKDFEAKLRNICDGRKKSCGCRSYINMARGLIHGHNRMTGQSPEYSSWHQLVQRCTNPNNNAHFRYGGNGISVCERWRVFEYFLEDMGLKPTPLHSIDRYPDKKGNYSCGHCDECIKNGWKFNGRWATRKQQSANREVVYDVIFRGEKRVLPEVCDELGIDNHAVTGRKWYKKCSIQEAFDHVLQRRGISNEAIPPNNFISHSFGHIKVA